MTAVLEVDSINKSFGRGRRRKQVLNDVGFEVVAGEALGFIGTNGAGKSTTIKIIMDVLRADSGRVRLHGIDASNPRARCGLGYVPENPYLYDYLTPYEVLRMGISQHRISKPDRRAHCLEWLDRFGIASAAHRKIRALSKGMTQRTALAHALACEPDLLILDEPLSGLDPLGRIEVVDILADYRRNGGTLFFTSHILHDVERIADRYALIHDGSIQACKTARELFQSSEGNFEIYIDAESPLDGYVHEVGNRWSVEVKVEHMPDLLNAIRGAGHGVLSIRPKMTLEKVFFRSVEAGGK